MKKEEQNYALKLLVLTMITNNLLQPMTSSRELPELDSGDVVKSAEARCKQIQGAFFNCPRPPSPLFSIKIEKSMELTRATLP